MSIWGCHGWQGSASLAADLRPTGAITRRTRGGVGSEQSLDLLLAYPVARGRAVREKFVALCLLLCALGVIFWLALIIGAAAINMQISRGHLVALGASAAVAVAGYFAQSLASLVGGLLPIARVSPFYYDANKEPVRHGLNAAHTVALLVAMLVLFTVALALFKRRDLGV